jgi:hypothetical protein
MPCRAAGHLQATKPPLITAWLSPTTPHDNQVEGDVASSTFRVRVAGKENCRSPAARTRGSVTAGLAMLFTIILAYVTAIAGVVMIAVGAWGFYILISEKSGVQSPRIYYALMIGLVCIGVGLFGVARALSLLLVYGGP